MSTIEQICAVCGERATWIAADLDADEPAWQYACASLEHLTFGLMTIESLHLSRFTVMHALSFALCEPTARRVAPGVLTEFLPLLGSRP